MELEQKRMTNDEVQSGGGHWNKMSLASSLEHQNDDDFEADEEDLSLISNNETPQDSGEGGDTTDAPKLQEIHEARQVRRKKTMMIGVSTLIVLIVFHLRQL